ncbi:glycosyltransferase family 4 protein [Prosthecomicrobium sp. N25]|uniref:glycosyltransferase family 4 protein n=1 Tax=Prosthecomicrobium sp. N25 TaxID=3129254 RepID=UPI0030775460
MADRTLVFAIPGDLATPTGGYAYDRRLIAELSGLGWRVDHLALPAGFPDPDAAALAQTAALMRALAPGTTVMVDGLALGVLPDLAAEVARRGRLVALVHHPLALETGVPHRRASALADLERRALASAAAILVTSPATGRTLVESFEVPLSRLTVAVPGTDPAPHARGSGGPGTRILTVGTLVPRKGHLDLVAALARLAELDWSLDLVGSADLEPAHAAAVRAAVEAHGLAGRIRLVGAIPRDALEAYYDGADLFVLASHYEGYGMAYAEAVAHGLPVVGTTGGAIPDTLGRAAVLVPPGDPERLALALRPLLSDGDARADLAARARDAAAALPTWGATARTVAAAIESLA